MAKSRNKFVWSDIVKRTKDGERTVRELSCSHRTIEPQGGKAAKATQARCAQCSPKEAYAGMLSEVRIDGALKTIETPGAQPGDVEPVPD